MTKLPRIPSPPSAWFRELRITVLPFVAFAVVLGLTIVTWRRYAGPSMLVGEVEPLRTYVTAPHTGRVTILSVEAFERVTAGQVIGQLNPSDPRILVSQLRLTLAQSRLNHLRDALDARFQQQNNRVSYLRLRIEWLDQRAELAALQAQESYYQNELERQKRLNLEPGGFSRPAELEAAQRDLDSLKAEIAARQALVDDLEAAIAKVVADEAALMGEGPAALQEAIAMEEKELGIFEEQFGPVPLIAPIDGVVATVHRRAGENVADGELILTISGDRPERVIGFIRQPIKIELRPDMPIEVCSRGRKLESGRGRVISVGTQLEPVLPELLPRGTGSNVIEYGLPFLVSLPAGLQVVGGETVDLRLIAD